jgi:hypothetical protein
VAFLLFAGLALPDAKVRIYWVWTILGLCATGGLLWGLKANRLRLAIMAAAVALLATYALYWIVLATSMYPQLQGMTLATRYVQDWGYVLTGNVQQGYVWLAATMIYVQALMPLLQFGLLVATLVISGQKPAPLAG